MKIVNIILILAVIAFFFLFAQEPQARQSTESPDYMNPEQAKEEDLQKLLTIWYDEAKKYQINIDNCKKNGDENSAVKYESKLTELKNRIDQVLPIMQKYD